MNKKFISKHSQKSLISRQRVLNRVCERLSLGETLTKICNSKELPDRRTIIRWQKDDPDIFCQILKARKIGAWNLFDESIDRLKDAKPQFIHKEREIAHHVRWIISKLIPDVFSDKKSPNVSINGEQIEVVWAEEKGYKS